MYETTTSAAGLGFLVGVLATYFIVIMAIAVIALIGMWKMYSKAGEPGWAAIVPFYNIYVLFKISWGNGWYFLLTLIPFVNIVIVIITYIKLAKAFGKDGLFAVGLVFLAPIFMLILGFGSAEYQGVQSL